MLAQTFLAIARYQASAQECVAKRGPLLLRPKADNYDGARPSLAARTADVDEASLSIAADERQLILPACRLTREGSVCF